MSEETLLTEDQAAELLCLKPATLQNWRTTRRVHVPFVRLGAAIRYRCRDLLRFLDKNTVRDAGKDGHER